MITHRRRHGIGTLTIVLFFSLVIGVLVFAMHSLWQGSSRTLFSIQEHRELLNLGRSALSEAYFEVQKSLDTEGGTPIFYWFVQESVAPDRHYRVEKTLQGAAAIGGDPVSNPGNIQYQVLDDGDVDMVRVRGLPEGPGRYAVQGIVDFKTGVKVTRIRPRHETSLRLVARHYYRLERHDYSPWYTGDRLLISKMPIGTWIEDEIP